MKRFLGLSIGLVLLLTLACVKEKTALEHWKEQFENEDPVDAMKFPKGSGGGSSDRDQDTRYRLGGNKSSLSRTQMPRGSAEDLFPLDLLPDEPLAKSVTILSNGVKLRKGPGPKYKVARKANKNDVFTLLETKKTKKGTWHFIQDIQGNKFFVSDRDSRVSVNKEGIRKAEKVSLKNIETIFDPTPPLPPELVQAKHITLNFEGTDVYDVITTFCELLKIDYVIEGPVTGKVTLQTFNNIPVQDLYSVLEQILALNNLTVVRSGNFFRFLPIKDAIKKPVSIHFGGKSNIPDNDRLIIQIIPLKHISADSMKKIITPLLTPNATFLDVPETNFLMLVELASNVKRIVKVVQALDIDKLAQSDVQLYRIENADSDVLVEELEEIFSTIGYKEVLGDSLNFLAIERLNSILVVNAFEDIGPTIEFWIEKLDQPELVGISRLSTFVYYVQNGEASTLASLLKSVFPDTGKKDTSSSKSKKKDSKSKTSSKSGKSKKASDADSKTKKSAGLASPRKSTKRSDKKPKVQVKGGVDEIEGELTIIADEDTNALIIRTNPRNYPAILELIGKLDLMPQQVLIEVLIVDLSLDESVTTGIEWALQKRGDLNITAGNTNIGVSSIEGGELFGGSATTLLSEGLSFFVEDPGAFQSLLQALASDAKADILANPMLVTSDNKAASISITQEVPIVTTTSTLSSATPTTAQQVEFRSVGIILDIEPKINRENFVALKIDHEISELGVESISGQPTFNTRNVSTEVVLKDNETLVMGGLIRNRTTINDTGIPYLMDIPYLGRLFSVHDTDLEKTELMLFITPHIISNVVEAKDATRQIQNRLSDFKKRYQNDRSLKELVPSPPSISQPEKRPQGQPIEIPKNMVPPPAPAQNPQILQKRSPATTSTTAVPGARFFPPKQSKGPDSRPGIKKTLPTPPKSTTAAP